MTNKRLRQSWTTSSIKLVSTGERLAEDYDSNVEEL